MTQNESPKPSAVTQQKESQGREYIQESKGSSSRDNEIKERITIRKVEG